MMFPESPSALFRRLRYEEETQPLYHGLLSEIYTDTQKVSIEEEVIALPNSAGSIKFWVLPIKRGWGVGV